GDPDAPGAGRIRGDGTGAASGRCGSGRVGQGEPSVPHPGDCGRELQDCRRHSPVGWQSGRHQSQAGQVRQPPGSVAHDRHCAGSPDDGHDRLHDRKLGCYHGRGASDAAGGYRGPRWRCAAPGRSLRRRLDRRRPGPPSHRSRAWLEPAMTERYGQVALPLPLARPYTYRIPEAIGDRIEPGARVVVPVRGREMVGIVVAIADIAPERAAKDILAAPDPEPALPLPLLEAATWMARYYGAPLGLAIRAALPAALWGQSKVLARIADGASIPGGLAGEVVAWLEKKGGSAPVPSIARGLKRPVWDAVNRLARVGAIALEVHPAETDSGTATERIAVLAGPRLTLLEREAAFGRAPAQRGVLEALEQTGGRAPVRHLLEQLKLSPAGLRALVKRRLAVVEEVPILRDPFADAAGTPPPPTLTQAQREAVSTLTSLAPGDGGLLFGVTGSGKTLVYLDVIRQAMAEGRGAIILVPEIGLTPQTVSRVRGVFGNDVAVLHSGLSEGERADAWRALRSGTKRVAVGARSAVFAPVRNLGVIVIDEEHEASYKNGEAPRYHARDVAMVRARLEGATFILGSATPSPESMARVGPRLTLVRLPERVGARPLPEVELVDLRSAPRLAIAGAVPWSERLDLAVTAALDRKEQVLLLLNRRGFGSFLQCPAFGEVEGCPRCSIALTVHRSPNRLRCHYCGHEEPVPAACRKCGNAVQQMRG